MPAEKEAGKKVPQRSREEALHEPLRGASGEPSGKDPAGTTPSTPVRGREHGRDKRASVYWLAAATAVIGMLGMVPGGIDIVDHFRFLDDSPGVSRWAFLLLLLGCVQIAYAFYAAQLPDWSSVWVVALACLALAALYALILALILMSSAENPIIDWLHLDRAPRGKSARWCFMMLSLTSLLAYFAGRYSVRWHRIDRLQPSVSHGPAGS